MAKDLKLDPTTGDLVIDPVTHDLETVEGAEELAQRIRATLDIRYGEMKSLYPDVGADYSNMLGKDPDLDAASADMQAAIEAQVPEVESVDEIIFTKLPGRRLQVEFSVTYVDESGSTQQTKGDYDIGS